MGDVRGNVNYDLSVVLPGSVNLLPPALFSMYVTLRGRGERVHAALVHARIGCGGGDDGVRCLVAGLLPIYVGYYRDSGDKYLLCEEFPSPVLSCQCVTGLCVELRKMFEKN